MILNSVILQTATRLLISLLLLLSVWILLRGHNLPGGGFIGGLVGASACALYTIAYGVVKAKAALRLEPRLMIGLGLVVAVFSGFISIFFGDAFLAGQWLKFYIFGSEVKIGTPTIFDIGVYFVVIGVTLAMIFALEEINLEYEQEAEISDESLAPDTSLDSGVNS